MTVLQGTVIFPVGMVNGEISRRQKEDTTNRHIATTEVNSCYGTIDNGRGQVEEGLVYTSRLMRE